MNIMLPFGFVIRLAHQARNISSPVANSTLAEQRVRCRMGAAATAGGGGAPSRSGGVALGCAVLAVLATLVTPARAASLYWDGDGVGTVGGGAGTWNTTGLNWGTSSTGTAPFQAWNNGGTDDAYFQNTPGDVTIGVPITARFIVFGVSGYSLLGTNAITLAGSNAIDTGPFTAAISAPIAGVIGLNKFGTGALTLGGTSTYTGPTTVSAGTLRVNGSLNAGSAVTVLADATLSGGGTVGGNVTLSTGAKLDPGTAAGTIAALSIGGSLTWNGSSNSTPTIFFEMDVGGVADQIVVTGNILKGAAGSTYVFDFRGSGAQGTYVLIRSVSGTHNFAAGDITYTNLKAGLVGSFDLSDTTRIKFTIGDDVAPTVSIGPPSLAATNTGPVTYTVTYVDANFSTSTLSTADITLNRTGSVSGTLGVSGSGLTRTVTISNISGDGTLGISIAANTAYDTSAKYAPAAGPSETFRVSNTAPFISSSNVATAPYRVPFSFTVTTTATATITASGLPDALSFDGTIISGTPAITGVFNVALTATDALGNQAFMTLVLTVPRKAVTVAGITVFSRPYNGTTSATLNVSEASLSGVFGADLGLVGLSTVGTTAAFADAGPGFNKPVTVSGLSLTGSAAGNYILTQPTITGNILGGPATIALAGLEQVYDGTPKNVTATTVPAGLAVSLTYNGSATAPTNGGSYTVSATFIDSSYTGSASGTLTIARASQTVTFSPPSVLNDTQPVALTASASSGLPVTFSVVSGPATVSGSTLIPTGAAGAIVVRARQAGDGNYNSAELDRTLTLNKAGQTIAFTPPNEITVAQAVTLSATASSGLPVTFAVVSGPATISGNTLTATATGTVVVRASQAGNATYGTADLDRTIAATKLSQTIAFSTPGDLAAGLPVTLSATASSGLPVTISVISGPATISGSTLTPTSTGTVVLRASQAGNASYNAVELERTLTITLIGQTITFAALPDKFATDAPFTLTASASSGLPISYVISGPAFVSGNTVAVVGVEGAVTVTASQPGNASYSPAVSVSRTFTVRPLPLPGTRFGTFGGDAAGAGFGFLVRTDGTGVFAGFLPRLGQGLLAEGFTVDRTGQFVVNLTAVQLAAQDTFELAGRTVAAATVPVTLRGRISGDGTVTGTIDGTGITFSGSASPSAGSASASAGLYRVVEVGTTGTSTTVLITGADGRAYIYKTDGTRASGSSASVGTGGTVVATLSDQSRVALTLDGASKTATGTVTSATGTTSTLYGVVDGVEANQRLINMSTLGRTSDNLENTLITGFSVRGDAPKRLLIRVAGPALPALGVAGALTNPNLQLYIGTTQIALNDDWGIPVTSDIVSLMASAGAFPFANGSRDAALVVRLSTGSYSVHAKGGDGMVLTEIYELPEAGEVAGVRRLVNISTRGTVSVGGDPLTAGFVISGPLPKKVLVRGVGPGLSAFGVTGAIVNPRLQLYRAQTRMIENDDWFRDADAAQTSAAALASGAFAFGAQSLDSALLIVLQPGNYTAQVASLSGPTGVALVEVYEVP